MQCPGEYTRVRTGIGKATRTRGQLVRLHRKLIAALHSARSHRAVLQHELATALALEDVLEPRGAPLPTAQYWWVHVLQPTGLVAAAGAALLLSCVVIWSELTGAVAHPVLSLVAQLMRLPHVPLQLAVFALFAYMGACTWLALFRLRLFDFFRLIAHQHTDSHSLLFSAAYASRLMFPLAYNFVLMARVGERLGLLRAMGALHMVRAPTHAHMHALSPIRTPHAYY